MSEVQATEWKPKVNPWIIAVTVSLAAFMEVLDSSIANVALPHIAGGLGVSNDESTWVLTSYLVSNAIVLPLSGYMVSTFGRKRFFLACIALFTLSSFLCGAATSLGLLLLFRVTQGAFGVRSCHLPWKRPLRRLHRGWVQLAPDASRIRDAFDRWLA